MLRRPGPGYFAALLVVLQLFMVAFTYADAASVPGSADCAGMGQDVAMNMSTGDCDHMTADGGCPTSGQHCAGHAACPCPCAHTPAMGTVESLVLDPAPPIAAQSLLATPAFDPPVFKLLRPPK